MERYLKTKTGNIIDTTYKFHTFVSKEEFKRLKELNAPKTIVSCVIDNTWYCYCEADGKIWDEQIVMQSNNPKDLCDKFVIVDYYINKPLDFDSLEEAQNFLWEHKCKEKDYTIKGANWTVMGLVYVVDYDSKTKECRLG